MTRHLTCIVCPRGCDLSVELDEKEIKQITGYTCKRGLEYAKNECTHPTRTLTTTMRTANGHVVAVRTDKPIPKELLFDSMKKINASVSHDNVKIGDILIENLLGTGANVIASQNEK